MSISLHLPKEPTDIDEEWIRKLFDTDQDPVSEVEINAKGIDSEISKQNFMSQLVRMTANVSRRSGNLMYDIVVKFTPSDDDLRQFFKQHRMFHKEVCVYDKLSKEYVAVQKVRCFPFPAPKCYFARIDEDGGMIVMEDLKKIGYLPPMGRLNDKQTKFALKKLAELHAVNHIVISKSDDVTHEYPDLCFILKDENFFNILEQSLDCILECSEATPISNESKGKLETFYKCIDFFEYFHNFFLKSRSPLFTFIHGDCWKNNLMFAYDENDDPSDLKFVDWQMSKLASVFMDLVYFILTSTANEVKTNVESYLREYYDHVAEIFEDNAIDTFNTYSFDSFLDDWRQHIPAFFPMTIAAVLWTQMRNAEMVQSSNQVINMFKNFHLTLHTDAGIDAKKLIMEIIQDLVRWKIF